MRAFSLRKRFFTNTAMIALLVMVGSMLVVDISYRGELERSIHEKLQLQVFSLLSVVQLDADIYVPDIMFNPVFNRLGSGQWLVVTNEAREPIWHSLSIEDYPENFITSDSVGTWAYGQTSVDTNDYVTAAYLVAWEYNNQQYRYHLIAGEDRQILNATVMRFRLWLFGGFFLTTLVLMGCQYWGLKGAFRPIADLEKEISALETGDQHHIEGQYPQELVGVSKRLNALIDMEHKHRERYRSGMADMAHSLKTPLAVIIGEIPKYDNEVMRVAADRINKNIEYQLRRAVIADHQLQTRGTDIPRVVSSIVSALNKVYRHRNIGIVTEITPELRFRGDENDLTEVLGNLLDNAYKYAKSCVRIAAEQSQDKLIISIEDDGDGLNDEDAERVFSRGEQLDDQGLGQGIGLAVAYDVVKSYQGKIQVQRSALGGAMFILHFPMGV